jgi:hypothetical protein
LHVKPDAMSLLDKQEAHLQKKINESVKMARIKARAKDKRGALFHLKRKKIIEKQMNNVYGKKMNLETQILTLEGLTGDQAIFKVMKQGQVAMTSALKVRISQCNGCDSSVSSRRSTRTATILRTSAYHFRD